MRLVGCDSADAREPDEVEPAFEAALRGRADAFLAVGDLLPDKDMDERVDLGLPSLSRGSEEVDAWNQNGALHKAP